MKRDEAHLWHETDDFWELTAPFMFPEEKWEGTVEEIDQLLAFLEIEPGSAVLDMCCGPGRHALEMARRRYAVTGVDRTGAHLQKARRRANQDNLTIEFVLGDMRDFKRADSFDCALLLFTSFGYFENPQDNLKVLSNVQQSLKINGSLVVDLMGKEVLARIFRPRNWIELDGSYLLEEREVCKNWSWIENRWVLLHDNLKREFSVTHWLYSATELTAMLKQSGFQRIEIFGSLDGRPYDNEAKRLVAVAHNS